MEVSNGPLSSSLFRALTDKLYEKRKAAALEIEKIVREHIASEQTEQIEKILYFLSDLAKSPNPNLRKGGLIGLAAFAIATGKIASRYTDYMILPVLESFSDPDSRVRYYACESLYNIVKILREAALKHFSVLFNTLAKSASDADQNVRSGADLLDRSMKDIVTACSSFQVSEFMCLLRERIYTKNSATRRFLVSWVQTLYAVPQICLVPYLPEVLDGFFHILSDETVRTRETCEAVLGEFLRSIVQKPEDADLQHMVNVLIVHAQSSDDLVRHIALIWLREFLILDGVKMLQSVSGYLTAILPCLAYVDDVKKKIRDTAVYINEFIMKLIGELNENSAISLDLQQIIFVLHENLHHPSVQTRLAVLRWIHHLYKTMPTKTFSYVEELFPILLQLLPDSSDEVVLMDLEVLSDICSNNTITTDAGQSFALKVDLPTEISANLSNISPYFVKFIISLLDAFRKDIKLLSNRGSFIIRQLCVLLDADKIFYTLAVYLTAEQDVLFASQMVQMLNTILLTSTELFPLRSHLKDFNSEQCSQLFVCLYKCWCHQPIALISLCLLTRNYEHAARLIHIFSDLEVTVEFLTEIDKLIQLLESPIFTYLRLQLLDPVHQPFLLTVLYGLLMLLPQTEAFHTLHRRLQCLPHTATPTFSSEAKITSNEFAPHKITGRVDFDSLVKHFQETQERHKDYKRMKRREMLNPPV